MMFIKNTIASIILVCVIFFISAACTPKNENKNENVKREAGSYRILDDSEIEAWSRFNDTRENIQDIVQIDDFIIRGSELVSYYGRAGNFTIPEELGITSIGSGVFSHSWVSSIKIPKEIVFIHEYAFENCHNLESISVSEDNEQYSSIDGVLFNKEKTVMIYVPHGKTGSFTIPDTVTVINNFAFTARSGLTSIIIPASITSIGASSFNNTVRLESIEVDQNNRDYTSIDGVLLNKTRTAILHYPQGREGSFVIPNTITRIDNYTFRSRRGLTSITIPNSVTVIGREAFSECSGLDMVDIPGSVINIGESAFSSCGSLTTVILNEGLTNIHDEAFNDCINLTSINIPASVRFIGRRVFISGHSGWMGPHFSSNSKLTSINVEQGNQNFTSIDGVLFNKNVTELIHFPQSKAGSYSIPNTVTRIESHAFSNRTGITSVAIPASVIFLGEDIFFGCSNLTSITVDQNNQRFSSADGVLFNKDKTVLIRFPRGKTGSYVIPNTVNIIGNSAFARATGLTLVAIPSSVTRIGETAFAGTSLKSIILPNSITHIGSGAFADNYDLEIIGLPDNYFASNDQGKGGEYFFYGCVNLKRFIASRNNKYYSTVDGVLLSKDGKELIRFPQGRSGSYTIPSTVTSIRYKAFYKSERLTSVTIPNSVTSIGDFAFDGSGITSLDIPNSVLTIGKYSFTRCLRLASVNIGSNVASIGDFAFYNCTGLREFNVDNNNRDFFFANGVLSNKRNTDFITVIHTTQQDNLVAR